MTPGAWFHGRIYERRCDLLPDGSLFVYFAANWDFSDVTYQGSWTAVSRPPWLTALALWPKGGAWNGGGLFRSDRSLWVNHGPDGVVAHQDHQPRGLDVSTESRGRGEDFPIFGIRLERDGWTKVAELRDEYNLHGGRGNRTVQPLVYERPLVGSLAVLQLAYSQTDMHPRWDYSLSSAGESARARLDGAEWADSDEDRGVVFAKDGCLFRTNPPGDDRVQIADFNADVRNRRKSPPWARQWPWEAT